MVGVAGRGCEGTECVGAGGEKDVNRQDEGLTRGWEHRKRRGQGEGAGRGFFQKEHSGCCLRVAREWGGILRGRQGPGCELQMTLAGVECRVSPF